MAMNDDEFGEFYGPNVNRMTRILEGNLCSLVNPNIRSLFIPFDERKESTALDACDNFSSCEIYCLGIPNNLFEDELHDFFKLDEVLYEITIWMNPETDKNRGIARVQYASREAAVRAQKELNNRWIKGNQIEVFLTVPDRSSVRVHRESKGVDNQLMKLLTKLKLDDELEETNSNNDQSELFTFKREESLGVLLKESMGLRISWNKKSIPSAINANDVHTCQKSTSTSYCICITQMLEKILDKKREVDKTKKTKSEELAEKAKKVHDRLYAHHSLMIEDIMPENDETDKIIMATEYAEFALRHSSEPDETYLKTIHQLIEQKAKSGEFRKCAVFVGLYGIPMFCTAPDRLEHEVQNIIEMLRKGINEIDDSNAIIWAMRFHVQFLVVHPFCDGNGRTSRGILSAILNLRNFPKIIIPTSQSNRYFEALRIAQQSGNYTMIYRFLCKCILTSLTIYQEILLKQ